MAMPVKHRIVRGSFERAGFGVIMMAKMLGVAETKRLLHELLRENQNPIKFGKKVYEMCAERGR